MSKSFPEANRRYIRGYSMYTPSLRGLQRLPTRCRSFCFRCPLVEDPFVRKRRALTPKFSSSDGLAIPRRVKKVVLPGTPTRSVTSTPTPRSSRRYTPYVDRVNPREPSKPLLSHQSPPTQALIRKAMHGYRADAIARTFFYQATKDLNAPHRALRFECDIKYQENVLKMIMRCDSQVRGEVVLAAHAAVPAAFNLGTGRGSPDVNKLFVALLLTKNNFVFREIQVQQVNPTTLHVIKRIGPYRKGIIAALIESKLFHT
ncbi:hypothetical protein AURDEDRAFT_166222 [Auricularia subglabra TFB-10046 SS5]|nr:hypothetical protein AURDEDRAFT_166222 [Auricularia subglabra TFB-10046 SS5]